MITAYEKSYVYLPKLENEESRSLHIQDSFRGLRCILSIRINDIPHSASYEISMAELHNIDAKDFEDYILRRMCDKYREKFEI